MSRKQNKMSVDLDDDSLTNGFDIERNDTDSIVHEIHEEKINTATYENSVGGSQEQVESDPLPRIEKTKRSNKNQQVDSHSPSNKNTAGTVIKIVLGTFVIIGGIGGYYSAYEILSANDREQQAKYHELLIDLETYSQSIAKLNEQVDKISNTQIKLSQASRQINYDLSELNRKQNDSDKKLTSMSTNIQNIETGFNTEINNTNTKIKALRLEMNDIENSQKSMTDDVNRRFRNIQTSVNRTNSRNQEAPKIPAIKSSQIKQSVTPKKDTSLAKSIQTQNHIGHFKIDSITPYGGELVATLSNGVSGSISVISGDVFGQYQVIEVDDDGIVLLDRLSGNKFFVIAES